MFEMKPVPKDKQKWKIRIDGVEVSVGLVELISDRHGRVVYGMRPEGYDGWVLYEPGGGGAATVPFAKTPSGELLVGLLLEDRLNMGGKVFDLMGGFIDPGESHAAAQVREAHEESGLDTAKAHELRGVPAVANRAYWVADATKGEGLHVWGVEVPFSSLKKDEAGKGFRIKKDIVGLDQKKASNIRFFPWREAVRQTPDALARSAIAQLLADVLSDSSSRVRNSRNEDNATDCRPCKGRGFQLDGSGKVMLDANERPRYCPICAGQGTLGGRNE